MAEVNLTGFGYVQSEDVTGNKTLDLGDCGVVQNATATCVVTLPATSAKNRFIVRLEPKALLSQSAQQQQTKSGVQVLPQELTTKT